jgi:competence protein ComEA
VRESNDPDDVVGARLRAVLDGPARKAAPEPEPEPGPFSDTSPVSWSDLIPSWPDDVDLPDGDQAPSAEPAYAWDTTAVAQSGTPAVDAEHHPLGGAGAFGPADSGRARLRLFDPGRRGVKALAAVALLVVIIAAVLAWRARPRVDPVDVPPVDAQAAAASTGRSGADAPADAARPSAGAEIVVAVGGKVRKPGLVRLPPGARVADALQAAGGADAGVDVAALNLARKVVDGELIMVGVTPPPGAATGPVAGPAGGAPGGQVNLNTATLADLDTLPGVGPVLAQRILDARTAQGGFKAVSDLRKVDGIGDSRYEQLKDLVVV